MRVLRRHVRLALTREVASGYSQEFYIKPLLQYKQSYHSLLAILLSIAICRKKSLFG